MLPSDEFTAHYSDLLDGAYDCVDRIVLNAHFRVGCSPGGFRTWWRGLYGNDDKLENSTLQRMAGRFSRRIRAYTRKYNIPMVYSTDRNNERKQLTAEEYLPKDPNFSGLFLVIVGRAPGLVWKVERSSAGCIRNIGRAKNQRWVNHFSFHIIDPQWGHIIFKLCSQPPFSAQIILNGHEYLARAAARAKVEYTKEGNCFTSVSSGTKLALIAETLCSKDAGGQLARLCDRWIYSACLFFALDPEEQKKSGFRYDYSVYQMEYSRNLLFHRGSELDKVMDSLVDQSRSTLDIPKIRTIFGARKRPMFRRGGKRRNEVAVTLERPEYNLTVFKVHFGRLTLKAYTKGERVLRFEAVSHNVRALHCLRSVGAFPEIATKLGMMLERFLLVLAQVDLSTIRCDTWDHLRDPSSVGKTRVPGIDISKKRMRVVIQAILALSPMPAGFQLKDLAEKVRELDPLLSYSKSHAAYDLRKLRGKGFIDRIPKSHRYLANSTGLQTMLSLLVIIDKVIRPVIAGAGKKRRPSSSVSSNPVEMLYCDLQSDMHKLFVALKIAA